MIILKRNAARWSGGINRSIKRENGLRCGRYRCPIRVRLSGIGPKARLAINCGDIAGKQWVRAIGCHVNSERSIALENSNVDIKARPQCPLRCFGSPNTARRRNEGSDHGQQSNNLVKHVRSLCGRPQPLQEGTA